MDGEVWWAKRRRKIVRRDNGKVVEFEEVRYLLKEGELLELFKGLEVIYFREEFNISTLVGRKVF